MPWALLLNVILQVLGPVLREWILRLLEGAVLKLQQKGDAPAAGVLAVSMLLDEAGRRYRWWWPPHWAAIAALREVRASLMPLSEQIAAAAQGKGAIPSLPREKQLLLEQMIGDV